MPLIIEFTKPGKHYLPEGIHTGKLESVILHGNIYIFTFSIIGHSSLPYRTDTEIGEMTKLGCLLKALNGWLTLPVGGQYDLELMVGLTCTLLIESHANSCGELDSRIADIG